MVEPIRITRIDERRGRHLVFITGLDRPVDCSSALVARHRLKAGIVITPAQAVQLQEEAEHEACDREITRLLAMRDHSIGEVRLKLKGKKFTSAVIDSSMAKYISSRMLDDSQFAHAHARRLLERKPAGRSWLVAHLRRKYISRNLAESVVDALLADRDENELAAAALRQRWSHLSQFDIETARRKAYTYLSRRGVGYEAARTAFKQLYDTDNEDSDH